MATLQQLKTEGHTRAKYSWSTSQNKWVYVYTNVYSGIINAYRDKVSVDTGKFIPGTYRVNPYTVWREEYDVGMYTSQHHGYSADGRYRYTLNGYVFAVYYLDCRDASASTMFPSLSTEALQKAYAKLGKGELSLGEDLGEIRETIEMIRRPVLAIRKFLNGSNRKNRRRLLYFLRELKKLKAGQLTKKAAKQLSSAWLEFRYGWSPLVATLADVLEELERKESKVFDADKIRCVRAKATGTSVTRSIRQVGSDYPKLDNCPRTTEDKCTGFASVQYRQSRPLTSMQNLGISPRFIPELAWELTGLSFVWDWFFTIGPWIQGFRVKPEITVLGATIGEKLERKVTLEMGTFLGTAPRGGPMTYRFTYYTRRIPSDQPSFPVFRVGDVMNLFKSIDSLALILQRTFR